MTTRRSSQRGRGRGPRATEDPRAGLMDAAVALIAAHGWPAFTLERLAAETGRDAAEVRRLFATPHDVLVALAERADAAMCDAARAFAPGDSAHDRLHALLFARLAAAAGEREAIRRLLPATACDPLLAAVHLRNLHATATRALALAGLAAEGPLRRLIQVKMLAAGVIAPVLPVWLGDDATDLARTDAALDRAVARVLPALRLLAPAGAAPEPVSPPDAGSAPETPPPPPRPPRESPAG